MIISRTPLRISFVGGGSDLKAFYKHTPGAVVSTAIDKYIYVFVNKRNDDLIRVSYSQTELVEDVDQIQHNIIRESLKLLNLKKGIEVVYMGDLQPGKEGTGLSSSSALVVGILHSLYVLKGITISKKKLAETACHLEIDILKNPIGKQDQYITTYGGFNYIQFNSDGSVKVQPIKLADKAKKLLLEDCLLLRTPNARTSSSNHILKIQQENTNKLTNNRELLTQMVKLAKQMKKELNHNKLDSFGSLLHENWMLKKQLAHGITNLEIDTWYNAARSYGNVYGKICGAGGGGFLLLYAPKRLHKKILKALPKLRPLPFSFTQHGSTIIYKS